ncbi:hypothetical protein AVT69_gp245 [Pseudomonas phage PhiPA3]|uniref:Uncharacterized protein 247 n=1 Tax=Pseudomonas phage PhiPA3 TaxID=998086 RepID=F8SJM1_BPPA3|nr:hypothetical protein AVT69_gp245 [Pseudomonas phage PhiPA3]AEH03670.1 hypothetical protein [Pseudomonas phage PhiPA3]
MKENRDKHQVVMATEVFNRLLAFAEDGAKMAGVSLADDKRHIRKFNLHLHQQRIQEVAEDDRQRREWYKRAKEIVNKHRGEQIVYHDGKGHYRYVKVIGLGKPKHMLRVGHNVVDQSVIDQQSTPHNYKHDCWVAEVPVWQLGGSIPDDYKMMFSGPYTGWWVSPERKAVLESCQSLVVSLWYD